MLKRLALLLAMLSPVQAFAGMSYMPANWELYGADPYSGTALQASSGNWVWPGSVLSTSVRAFPAQFPMLDIKSARLVVVWTPQANAAVRLVTSDSGPSNVQNCGAWVVPTTVVGTPTVSASDATACLNQVIQSGQWKQLGWQVSGNSTIHRVTLEIIWEVPTP